MKTSYYLVTAAGLAAAVIVYTRSSDRSGAGDLPPAPDRPLAAEPPAPPPFAAVSVPLPPVVPPPDSKLVIPAAASLPDLPVPPVPVPPAVPLPVVPAVPAPEVPSAPAVPPSVPAVPLPDAPAVPPAPLPEPPAVPPAELPVPPAVPSTQPAKPDAAPVPLTPVKPDTPAVPPPAPTIPAVPPVELAPVPVLPIDPTQPPPSTKPPVAPQPQPVLPQPAPVPVPAPAGEPEAGRLSPPRPYSDSPVLNPTGKYVVLRGNRLVEASVAVAGEKAVIRQGSFDRTVPKADVLFVAESKDEVRRFMLAKVPEADAAGRFGVARWLMYAGLREEALAEAREVMRLQPRHTAAAELVRSLEESLKSFPGDGKTQVVAAKPAGGVLEAVEPEPDVTAEGATTFSARAQPVLANQCMDCHARPDHAGAFKLIRITGFEVGPQSTRANLRATAGQIKKDDPANSPLLAKALAAHGGMKQPAFVSRNAPAYRALEAWVFLAAGPVVQPMTPPVQPVLPPTSVTPPANPAVPPVLPPAEVIPTIPPADPLATPPAAAPANPPVPVIPPAAPSVPAVPDVPPGVPAVPVPPVLPTPPSIPQSDAIPKADLPAVPPLAPLPQPPVAAPPVGVPLPVVPAPTGQFGTAAPPKPVPTAPAGGDEFDPAAFNKGK